MDVFAFALFVGEILDFCGVMTVFTGVIIASAVFLHDFLSDKHKEIDIYKKYRQNLGRAILLGLEILVAGDILRSIVGNPDFATVGILAAIVIIRTFLSITFDMEISGRWPWQKKS